MPASTGHCGWCKYVRKMREKVNANRTRDARVWLLIRVLRIRHADDDSDGEKMMRKWCVLREKGV